MNEWDLDENFRFENAEATTYSLLNWERYCWDVMMVPNTVDFWESIDG